MLRIYILIGLILTPLSLLVNSVIYDNMDYESRKFVDEWYKPYTSGDLTHLLKVFVGFSLRWVAWPISIISNIVFMIKLNSYLSQ